MHMMLLYLLCSLVSYTCVYATPLLRYYSCSVVVVTIGPLLYVAAHSPLSAVVVDAIALLNAHCACGIFVICATSRCT